MEQIRDRRPDGLGALQILPDEIICMILETLSPRDVARLACVSSVLYIFCNEEPLWMKLCLENFEGMLEYNGSWKQTTIEHHCLRKGITEISRRPLRFEGFNSLFLYRRWYRCHVMLETFSIDHGDVERRGGISNEEFHSQYDGKRPVLLTDLADNWKAKHTWTLGQLLERFGEVEFNISQGDAKKVTMKLKDYVSYMTLQHDEDPLYIFDPKFGEAAPALLEDYKVPYLFQEDFFEILDNSQRPPYRWLVLGPTRSGASWHVDPALTSAWNTLLQGRKRWALYPPGRVPPGVTVHVNEEDGDVNIESPSSTQWWLDIYPLLAEHDKPLECTQLPGETIFVPSGWWHCVLNLDTSVAVTQNFVNVTNFEFVCLDMAPGYRHRGIARAGQLALQEELATETSDMSKFEGPHASLVSHCNNGDAKIKSHGNLGPTRHCAEEGVVYSADSLSMYLEENRDHYNSNWSKSNCIGQREMREWLHRLWAVRPGLRNQIWKGACIALDAGKWLDCITSICSAHGLPLPSESEKLPVGTGSNPVYLIGDYVIKLYVEGGLESAVHSLGSELEFYGLLRDTRSPLNEHVPHVLASGILCCKSGSYESIVWDGKGVPPVIANCNLFAGNDLPSHYSFSVWNKATIEFCVLGKNKEFKKANNPNLSTTIWPYLITKRCEGEDFAHAREKISSYDYFVLASFLGEQVRNLHSLPLPPMPSSCKQPFHNSSSKVDATLALCNSQEKDATTSSINPQNFVLEDPFYGNFCIPVEWHPFIRLLRKQRKDVKEHLKTWGDPIPECLIDKVEEYLPHDPLALLNICRVENGSVLVGKSPTWLHMDIMDDNIQMEPYIVNGTLPDGDSTMNLKPGSKELDEFTDSEGKTQKIMRPTRILDFGDLSIGDPIYELIAVYIDVFRGNSVIFKHFLSSYNLPLLIRVQCTEWSHLVADTLEADPDKLGRLSYHAMCYCLLHEDNVMGAIFSLWEELRKASSWEEVEKTVWGLLNDYEVFC